MSIKVEHHLDWETGREHLRAAASLRGDALNDMAAQKVLREQMLTALVEESVKSGWPQVKRPVEFQQDVHRDAMSDAVERVEVRATIVADAPDEPLAPGAPDRRGQRQMEGSALALLTPDEVAAQLGIPVRTLYVWRSAGRPSPRATKVGRYLRFTQASIDDFIESQTEPERKVTR